MEAVSLYSVLHRSCVNNSPLTAAQADITARAETAISHLSLWLFLPIPLVCPKLALCMADTWFYNLQLAVGMIYWAPSVPCSLSLLVIAYPLTNTHNYLLLCMLHRSSKPPSINQVSFYSNDITDCWIHFALCLVWLTSVVKCGFTSPISQFEIPSLLLYGMCRIWWVAR